MAWNILAPETLYYGPNPLSLEWPAGMTDALSSLIELLSNFKEIAIDTETTGLNIWKDMPLYFSVAWGPEDDIQRATLHAACLPYFQEMFKDPSRRWLFANAKYDTHILANAGYELAGALVDTQVMHALLYEESPHNLKAMCFQLGGWTWGDFQDQFGKIGKNQSAEELIRRAEREDFGRLVAYAGNDALGTMLCYYKLRTRLQQAPTDSWLPSIETLWDYFERLEVPYTRTLWKMERNGVRIDKQKLADARPEAEAHLQDLMRQLVKLRRSQSTSTQDHSLRSGWSTSAS